LGDKGGLGKGEGSVMKKEDYHRTTSLREEEGGEENTYRPL